MESPVRDRVPAGTCLIETFALAPDVPVARLELHLARLAASARALGFRCSRTSVQAVIGAMDVEGPTRCRLTLDQGGTVRITTAELPPAAAEPWVIDVHETRLSSRDRYLRHKTTQRRVYDLARAALPDGVQEWVFLNERDEICEGTITNIAVETQDGVVLTPPVASGVLPGVYRQSQLGAGVWQEAVLTLDDLRSAKRVILSNALRGEIAAVWGGGDC
ncbi:aminotransferase class IV [Shimia abyssi]|uniref:Probable branched-chain-amino-acid aminotransferase n=1 Tax=Shimia abyssi TaxID=1662395 RepID=A0A2P8FJR2_9RHOB|nr:aminotransferase class IV [Shimia abyssi]PSL21953.1 4-amino-4-deoxychorismate lyase [Shimia abyssi]